MNMKKLLSGLAAGALAVSVLAACGDVEGEPGVDEPGMNDPGMEEPMDDGGLE
ncbi:hypothetical protein [Halalkalibacter sp. APA_J-10(15)]|uniref:hypothetical protein n=2 Tax=Halalkalibacter TaxID=2893056 RepID=UPI001FF4D558|nr:hypothetical protein [Halalkalibacter sp. APA_J-10(15)]MCK0471483.1 hypothetical protein [Halalkalibacter sp. APA_J-10(15)]